MCIFSSPTPFLLQKFSLLLCILLLYFLFFLRQICHNSHNHTCKTHIHTQWLLAKGRTNLELRDTLALPDGGHYSSRRSSQSGRTSPFPTGARRPRQNDAGYASSNSSGIQNDDVFFNRTPSSPNAHSYQSPRDSQQKRSTTLRKRNSFTQGDLTRYGPSGSTDSSSRGTCTMQLFAV